MNDLPDHGPQQRFEAVKDDPSSPDGVFQRVCEGESLKDIAKAWEVPRGQFVRWFTESYSDLYDAALKVHAADLAMEVLAIADEQHEVMKKDGTTYDPDVPRDKLRVDTRKWIASKFDRDRYGEAVKVSRDVSISIDAGLVGFARDLLDHIDTRPGLHQREVRVFDGATLTLPPTIDADEEPI